jgi:hypothetical protein
MPPAPLYPRIPEQRLSEAVGELMEEPTFSTLSEADRGRLEGIGERLSTNGKVSPWEAGAIAVIYRRTTGRPI